MCIRDRLYSKVLFSRTVLPLIFAYNEFRMHMCHRKKSIGGVGWCLFQISLLWSLVWLQCVYYQRYSSCDTVEITAIGYVISSNLFFVANNSEVTLMSFCNSHRWMIQSLIIVFIAFWYLKLKDSVLIFFIYNIFSRSYFCLFLFFSLLLEFNYTTQQIRTFVNLLW